jgi:hypothetical protein
MFPSTVPNEKPKYCIFAASSPRIGCCASAPVKVAAESVPELAAASFRAQKLGPPSRSYPGRPKPMVINTKDDPKITKLLHRVVEAIPILR